MKAWFKEYFPLWPPSEFFFNNPVGIVLLLLLAGVFAKILEFLGWLL